MLLIYLTAVSYQASQNIKLNAGEAPEGSPFFAMLKPLDFRQSFAFYGGFAFYGEAI
jgi:hypothetical protein